MTDKTNCVRVLLLTAVLLPAATALAQPRQHQIIRDPAVAPAAAQFVQPPEQVRPQANATLQPGAAVPAPNGGQDQVFPPGLGPGNYRLPLLGEGSGRIGTTPHPSPQKQAEYQQYIEQTVDPENTLDVVVHRPRLLVFKEAPTRVQIADQAIANFTLITEREISVAGEKVGSTLLNLWFADATAPRGQKVLSFLVRVMPDPEAKHRLELVYKALEEEINRNFPNSWVQLTLVGDKLVVRGEAKDTVEAAQILQVVGANAPGGQQQNTGGLGGQFRQQQLGDLMNAPVDIASQNQNMLGMPQDFVAAQQQAAEVGISNQILRVNANVINLLRVPGEQQVMLRVSVAEVNRNALRTIGVNFTITNDNGVKVFQQLAGAATIGAGNLPTMLDNGQVSLAINALRTLSLARSLAEPNLVTSNGQPAMFFAGIQFPVPAATATFGAVGQGVNFVPAGVSLMFTPAITDRDRIRLRMTANVSTRDPAASATVSGTNVPGLNARTFFTTVELREGQTLAVAGLLQNNFGSTADRIPLWGDLPLIGTLGGSRSTTSQEQELVILVTPELVHPLEACNTPPVPGADVFEPGDVEFYLLNRLESRRAYDFRASARTDWHRMKTYERCEEQLIIGAQGPTYGCCLTGCDCLPPAAPLVPSSQSLPAGGAMVPGHIEMLPTPSLMPSPARER